MRKETERPGYGHRQSARAKESSSNESATVLERATFHHRRLDEVPDYDAALARACRCLQSLQPMFDREQADAQDLVAELMVHPPERQKLIIRNNARFHTWGVYARLLDRSRAQSVHSPADTQHLARLPFAPCRSARYLSLPDRVDRGSSGEGLDLHWQYTPAAIRLYRRRQSVSTSGGLSPTRNRRSCRAGHVPRSQGFAAPFPETVPPRHVTPEKVLHSLSSGRGPSSGGACARQHGDRSQICRIS